MLFFIFWDILLELVFKEEKIYIWNGTILENNNWIRKINLYNIDLTLPGSYKKFQFALLSCVFVDKFRIFETIQFVFIKKIIFWANKKSEDFNHFKTQSDFSIHVLSKSRQNRRAVLVIKKFLYYAIN